MLRFVFLPFIPSLYIRYHISAYSAALPLDSKGIINTKSPAAMNNAPLVYTGADVSKFAKMAMIGCESQYWVETGFDGELTAMIPKILLQDAHNALPVPL